MPHVAIRPSVTDDVLTILGKPLDYPSHCMTMLEDGDVVGVGGIACVPEHGIFVAFAHLTDRARCHPLSLHRAGKRAMEMAKRMGARRVLATADGSVVASERWLKRHGFRPIGAMPDGKQVYQCSV